MAAVGAICCRLRFSLPLPTPLAVSKAVVCLTCEVALQTVQAPKVRPQAMAQLLPLQSWAGLCTCYWTQRYRQTRYALAAVQKCSSTLDPTRVALHLTAPRPTPSHTYSILQVVIIQHQYGMELRAELRQSQVLQLATLCKLFHQLAAEATPALTHNVQRA